MKKKKNTCSLTSSWISSCNPSDKCDDMKSRYQRQTCLYCTSGRGCKFFFPSDWWLNMEILNIAEGDYGVSALWGQHKGSCGEKRHQRPRESLLKSLFLIRKSRLWNSCSLNSKDMTWHLPRRGFRLSAWNRTFRWRGDSFERQQGTDVKKRLMVND